MRNNESQFSSVATDDKPTSHWPASQTNPTSTARPRSATVVITRKDGGVIAG